MSRHTRRRMSTQVSTQVSTHASPPQAQCLATFCWALLCTWQANLRATHGQKLPHEPRSSHQPLWDFWLKVKVTLGKLPDPDLIQGFFIHCCLHGNLQDKHTKDVTVNTVLCFVFAVCFFLFMCCQCVCLWSESSPPHYCAHYQSEAECQLDSSRATLCHPRSPAGTQLPASGPPTTNPGGLRRAATAPRRNHRGATRTGARWGLAGGGEWGRPLTWQTRQQQEKDKWIDNVTYRRESPAANCIS